ncbi:MAG TPA: crossover junction endodeoxyribonuclease RuvC [Bryobacteraceae bacterium]|nr:crossover junction endodeoxyribonuclease RuvC [Bryobacteraceae bacterium]
MRVLGIDCGSERTGYGVIESDGVRHRVLTSGVIRTVAKHSFPLRLLNIHSELRVIIQAHQPESGAVEDVFHALNSRTALKLAHVRGVVLMAMAEAGLDCGEYPPATVKVSVAGNGRAQKSEVQHMIRLLCGNGTEFETEDASDAVAVAICHATHLSTKRLIGTGV